MSAGESVEVTLPSNAVELNAFVVPTPPEGKNQETLDKLLQFINLKNCYTPLVKSCHLSISLKSAEIKRKLQMEVDVQILCV